MGDCENERSRPGQISVRLNTNGNTPGSVKLLLPPRQSRGVSHFLLGRQKSHAVLAKSQTALPDILHALGGEFWQPGRLHPNLSRTHYRVLLRVDKAEARASLRDRSSNKHNRSESDQHNWLRSRDKVIKCPYPPSSTTHFAVSFSQFQTAFQLRIQRTSIG